MGLTVYSRPLRSALCSLFLPNGMGNLNAEILYPLLAVYENMYNTLPIRAQMKLL
jgi:hypothetical protein